MERQFVSSVYIFHEDKVLLVHHKKLGKWLPAGGHIEINETPPEAALREAKEETGIDIDIITQENCDIQAWNAKSIERPYLCLIENIPEYKGTPQHQHIDFVYIAKPRFPELVNLEKEAMFDEKSRWFSQEEIQALRRDVDIFEETQIVINTIFNSRVLQTFPSTVNS